jgi:NADH:ubiquinone oxidoreductase subunit C
MQRSFGWQLVDPMDWRRTVDDLVGQGFIYFDFFTGVDRESVADDKRIEVVAHLAKPDLSESRFIFSLIHDQIESISDLVPAAEWHECECAEMFGVTFTGRAVKPLLRHEKLGDPPMLKSGILAARVLNPWPGGAEPEIKRDGRKVGNVSRRRQRPPGVPENWLTP